MRTSIGDESQRALDNLVSAGWDGGERHYLDPAIGTDQIIALMSERGTLSLAAERLETILASVKTEDALEEMYPTDPLPEGLSFRAWYEYVLARCRAVLQDAAVVPHLSAEERDPRLWRHTRQSRYLREGVVDRVVELVQEQHGDAVDAWTDGTHWEGHERIHLVADLSEHVEELGGPGARGIGESAPIVDGQLDTSRAVPVTHAVVVVNHGAVTGNYEVLEGHPEIALDLDLRSAYPDLVHWFGGFQTMHGSYPSTSTFAANRATKDPARSKVRDQLTLLLTQDDETIHRVLLATGSYTAPSGPLARHWVDRQLWRLDAWDWNDPRA